ncbi:hypothetical protein [Aeoliella sp.]|uniref:hypothetical protein n=1 Tax=Aeoliella sp. TaxID=2795800 RepID=UPI003CCC3E1C
MPFEDFQQEVSPWLARDMEEFADVEPMRENLGCWHISFPARVDQIVVAAAAAVRCMEEWAADGFTKTGLHVFEQDYDGIRRVQSPGGEL